MLRLKAGSINSVLEVHDASIFRVEMSRVSECPCIYVLFQETHGKE
jgi:hypothetical protein